MKLNIIIFFFIFLNSTSGQNWRAAGLGANFNIETFLTDSDNNLYVGGSFTSIDGLARTAIAIWDSVQWTNFGNNAVFQGTISCMTFFNGELIVGGTFDSINNLPFNNVAKWNGNNWQPLGSGFNHSVYTLQVYHHLLYAGGSFYASGLDTIGHLAKWSGTNWQSAVSSIDGYVFSSTIYKDKLILGGQFSQINGASFYNVAAFDDTSWSDLNIVFNNQVYKVKSIEDTLFVTGNFTQLPSYPFNYICKYDGNSWSQVSYPIGTTQNVTDVEKYNSNFYICGNFDNPDDLGLINGLNCDSVGSSNGFFVCMTTYKNELCVGGNFTSIGSLPVNCMAIYNDDFNSVVTELQYENLNIYPNPFSKTGNYCFSINHKSGIKINHVSIFSLQGQLLINSKDKYLQLDELSAGIYIVVTKINDEKLISNKLIITQ